MLGRIALRLVTVEALKSANLPGVEILDSQMSALDVNDDGSIETDRDQPFVSVYCESSVLEDDAELRSLHKNGVTDLVLETGISAAMTEIDQDTGATTIIGMGIPVTDAAMELFLDVTGRRVVVALTDPRSEWAEIWRSLSTHVVKIERKRAASAGEGVRMAAHQTVISLALLPDPVFGDVVDQESTWGRLVAQMDAAAHPFAQGFRDLLGAPEGVLDHEAQRRRFGLTLDEARALMAIAVRPAEATETKIVSVSSEAASP